MSYDTESKSRNVLASPLGEEGHEVAKGVQANWIHRGAPRPANPVKRHPAKSVWTVVRMIMTLDMDVTAERRHYNTHRTLKRKRLTTFCTSLTFPYKSSSLVQIMFAMHRFAQGTRSKKQKNFQSYSNSSTSILTLSREQAKEPCIMSFPPPRPWRRVFHSLRRGFRFTVPLPMA